jgi:hypothetical protein
MDSEQRQIAMKKTIGKKEGLVEYRGKKCDWD